MRLLLPALLLLFVACEMPDDQADPAGEDAPEVVADALAMADDMGTVAFQVPCADEAREDFDRGLALLHHMMYQESRGVFEAVADEHPDCAMAHWGVAMTLFQPLWPGRPGPEVRQRGWEAVQEARSLEPATERERALVDAAAAFWENPESDEWWPRIERWADAMEAAHESHPDDLDIAAFRGLSLLAVGQASDDQTAYNARAAEILTDVHAEEPLHPGAIHYTIHADDAGGRAEENLEVVQSYSEVAPQVPHALHMPSHIYVRLGDWPEVIEWNRNSADAALEYPADDRVSLHHIHALDYMLYGFLQRGEDEAAEETLADALSTGPYQEDFVSAFHLAIMPARYAVERRDWEEAAQVEPGTPDYLEWDRYAWPLALQWFARGLGAVMTDDLEQAREAESRMAELRTRAEDTGERAFATYIEIDRLILDGRIAWAEDRPDEAVDLTEEAAALEQTIEKSPVTPGALLPPYEALGDLLSDLGRAEEARAAYEQSLEIWPKRYRSLLGAARAARDEGAEERAREHYETLASVVSEETERAGAREARSAAENSTTR